jgi:hypothetical protein
LQLHQEATHHLLLNILLLQVVVQVDMSGLVAVELVDIALLLLVQQLVAVVVQNRY